MNVLVATNWSQWTRNNDFFFATEGELVVMPTIQCSGEPIDGPCGCKRSMCGVTSRKATTTVKVVSRPDMTEADLVEVVLASLRSGGWIKSVTEEDRKYATKHARALIRIAKAFPPDTVLERRGGKFNPRLRDPLSELFPA